MQQKESGSKKATAGENEEEVVEEEGCDIIQFVGKDEEMIHNNNMIRRHFVEHKTLKDQLQPALAHHQVMNDKEEHLRKTEFKDVVSDSLLSGMALNRDVVVILRIDGEDLKEFINGACYEQEMVCISSQIELPADRSLRDYIFKAFDKLTVDQGMPPSDSWVRSNIVEPALGYCNGAKEKWDKPYSEETFLVEFKKVGDQVAQLLKEQPVIVAHTETTFDGSSIQTLLSNKFELDKSLNAALESVPKDGDGRFSKEYLQAAVDVVVPLAGLPSLGSITQLDRVVGEALVEMIDSDDEEKMVKEEELKKLLIHILETIMLQLQVNPISFSSNSVIHQPLESNSSALLQPST